MTTEKARPGDSQSISRAVAVLRAIGNRPGASLGELSKATGLARSTVQRLVGALNSEGLVTKNFGQPGVFLGMELARLGAKVHLEPRVLLQPLMQELQQKIGENVDLTTLDHRAIVVIEQLASNEDIRVISFVGRQHPLHCTANGKAHLAQMSRAKARDLLELPLHRYTPATITDPEALLDQIEASRRSGLYVEREEFGIDTCAIAIPLPEIGGRQLALAIAMPSSRFVRREAEVRAALLAFSAEVQTRFGSSI